MASGALEVELVLPRRGEESSPVGLVQNGDDPVAAADELVVHDLFAP